MDTSGRVNICSNMSVQQYMNLKHEAMLSQQALDDSAQRGFESVFLKPVAMEMKYDTLIK